MDFTQASEDDPDFVSFVFCLEHDGEVLKRAGNRLDLGRVPHDDVAIAVRARDCESVTVRSENGFGELVGQVFVDG